MKLFYCVVGIILLQSVAQINGQDVGPSFCTDQGHSTGVLSHPTNCTLFVLCVFSMPFVQECERDSVFVQYPQENPGDDPFGRCEPSYPGTCDLLTTTTATTTTTTYEPSTNETTTYGPEIPRDICDGILFRRIPHQNNCYQYYFCIAQVPHLGECLDHQIFHPEWNICIRGNRDQCRFCLFC
ncbi:hypothetical protein ACKWTF_016070 [Chironomus riparius]